MTRTMKRLLVIAALVLPTAAFAADWAAGCACGSGCACEGGCDC